MSSVSDKADDAPLRAIARTMTRVLAGREQLQRDVTYELHFRFMQNQNSFELEVRSPDHAYFAHFFPSANLVRYQREIVPLLCAQLNTDGYTVVDAANPTASTAATNDTAPASQPIPAPSGLNFPSVASVFAQRDARVKAEEERRIKAQQEFDRDTLDYLHACIEEGNDLEFIVGSDKRGYQMRISERVVAGCMRRMEHFRRVIPLLQAAIGPTEKVTLVEGVDDAHLQVMEI